MAALISAALGVRRAATVETAAAMALADGAAAARGDGAPTAAERALPTGGGPGATAAVLVAFETPVAGVDAAATVAGLGCPVVVVGPAGMGETATILGVPDVSRIRAKRKIAEASANLDGEQSAIPRESVMTILSAAPRD
jgi:hypothetical protein